MASIEEAKEDEVVVLIPEGSLGATPACAALEKRLKAVLETGARQIVIDLEKTTAVGSGAVRILLLVSRKLAGSQGRLVLAGATEKVRRAFEVSGFDRDLAVVASRTDAVALARMSTGAATGPTSEPSAPAVANAWDAATSDVLALLGGRIDREEQPAAPASGPLGLSDEILRILSLP